jgi:hypothetical protein
LNFTGRPQGQVQIRRPNHRKIRRSGHRKIRRSEDQKIRRSGRQSFFCRGSADLIVGGEQRHMNRFLVF